MFNTIHVQHLRSSDKNTPRLGLATFLFNQALFALRQIFNGSRISKALPLVQLVTHDVGSELLLLVSSDWASGSLAWKNVFRAMIRTAGMENKPCTVFIAQFGGECEWHAESFAPSLRTILSHGVDFSLFGTDELQVILSRDGFLQEIKQNIRRNFHCIVDGPATAGAEMARHFDFSEEADYGALIEDLSTEIVGGGSRGDVTPGLLALIDASAQKALPAHGKDEEEEARWSRVPNFHRFLSFYRDHLEGCRSFYAAVSEQVARMTAKIAATVRESEERVAALGAQKERNKEKAAEQGELQRVNVRLKKEVEELDAVIEQHLRTVLEDKLTIARSKLAVGQEMATNYNLYQGLMSELQIAFQDEHSMEVFARHAGREESGVAPFQAKLQEIFEIETSTDEEAMEAEARAPETVKRLARTMSALAEEKIHEVNERSDELLALRKDIPADVKAESVVVELLVDAQRRIESLAKVIKTKNAKYARIESLGKNIAREEAAVLEFRKERQAKKALLKANLETIERLQGEIAARSEEINQLEQFASDFKGAQKDLGSFDAVLADLEQILVDKINRLPGTLLTMAAFAAFCGAVGEKWDELSFSSISI